MTVEDDFALEFIPILLDVIMLHHDDNHVNLIQELIEVEDLILHDFLLSEEGIKGLQRTGEMTLLNIEHLEGWTFTDVIDILFIGQTVEANSSVICDVMGFHDFVDTFQYKDWLVVVGFHRLVNHLG